MGIGAVKVPPHVFALDGRQLRYGLFVSRDGDLHFNEYHAEELPEGLFQRGPLGGSMREPGLFDDVLRALLGRVSQTVTAGALVLDDSWLRLTFADMEEVPRRRDELREVLRFKLKRLVPFRVEELRLSESPAPEIAGSERRFVVGFALENLLAQLEGAFSRQGIHIGQISNQSLSLISALTPVIGGMERGGFVYVGSNSYSVVVTERGEPVLYRFKPLVADAATREVLVPRDMRLTRDYLQRQLGGVPLGELIWVGPEAEQDWWCSRLEEVFELPVRSLVAEWPEIPGQVTGVPTAESAPLLGAALREVVLWN